MEGWISYELLYCIDDWTNKDLFKLMTRISCSIVGSMSSIKAFKVHPRVHPMWFVSIQTWCPCDLLICFSHPNIEISSRFMQNSRLTFVAISFHIMSWSEIWYRFSYMFLPSILIQWVNPLNTQWHLQSQGCPIGLAAVVTWAVWADQGGWLDVNSGVGSVRWNLARYPPGD